MKKLYFILPIILFLYPIYLIIYSNINYFSLLRLEMVAVTISLLIYNINSNNFFNNSNTFFLVFIRVTAFYLLIVPGYSIVRNIIVDKNVIYYNLGILEYTDGYLFLLFMYFTIISKLKNKTKLSTD